MSKLSLTLLTLAAFCAAGGQLLFKIGADKKTAIIEFLNLPIFFGLFLYVAGTVIWIYMLSSEKLVNVYAFTALTFVIVYLGGVTIVGEKMSFASMGGVALVLAGLYLIVNFNH